MRAPVPECSTRGDLRSARLFVRRHPRPQPPMEVAEAGGPNSGPRQQHPCWVKPSPRRSPRRPAGVLLAGWPPVSPRRGVAGSADPFQPGTCSTAVMGGIPRQIRPEFEPCRECRCINRKRSRITVSKSSEARAPDLEFALNSVNASAAGEVRLGQRLDLTDSRLRLGNGHDDPRTGCLSSLSQMVHPVVSARRGPGRSDCGDPQRAATT